MSQKSKDSPINAEPALAGRKKEEEELRDSSLPNTSTSVLWTTNKEGVFVNPQSPWQQYTGQSWNDHKGWGWLTMIHEDDRKKVQELWTNAVTNKTEYHSSGKLWSARHKHYRYFEASGMPVLDEAGNVKEWVGMIVDVHEQKASEKALKESEAKFRSLIEEAPVATCFFTGREMTIEIANDIMIGYWGKGKSVIGKPLAEALPELNGQPFLQILDDVFTTGKTYEEKNARADLVVHGVPGVYYFDFTYKPLLNAAGEVYGIMDMAVDVTEQVLSRKKIEESESFSRTVLENSPDCVKIIDTEGRLQFMNTNGMSIMEIDDFTPFKNKPYAELWGEESRPLAVKAITTALSGKTAQFQALCPTVKGNPKWWDVKVSPVKDVGTDKIINLIAVSRDMTGQRASQNLLEYRKALLEAHNEASNDGILLVDVEGKILSYNHRFVEIWNMPQYIVDAKDDKAALSFAMTQLVNPEQFIEKVNYLYEHPTLTSTDILEYKDGKIVERHGYPVVADDGTYYAWSWTFRDITYEKLTERKIKESEENFRQLAELMPEKVSSADAEGNIIYYNQSWLDYTGYSFDDLKNWGWEKVIHPDDGEELTRRWRHCLMTGNDFEMDFRILQKNGDYRWHMCRSVALKNDNGEIIKWIAATTEVQEQKEQKEELEKAVAERTRELKATNLALEEKNEALENLNKELESFTYISSHDLQEPLRKIQAFASRIMEKEQQNLTDTGKDYFRRMQQAANRMQRLIEDLLVYSRTSSKNQSLENTDLRKIAEEVKAEFREDILEKNATIEVGEMCPIHVVPFQAYQLFANLISNSLKFSTAGRPPHIILEARIDTGEKFNQEKKDLFAEHRLSPQKKYCHISITDNGIGFNPQYKDRIFEVFQRLHGKNEYSGTGIGLAIVKKIVDNHNGVIIVSSEVNKGTSFDIYIPAE